MSEFTKEELEELATDPLLNISNDDVMRLARALLDAQDQLSTLKAAAMENRMRGYTPDKFDEIRADVAGWAKTLKKMLVDMQAWPTPDQPTGATEIEKDGEPQSKLQKLNDRMLSLVRDKDGDS